MRKMFVIVIATTAMTILLGCTSQKPKQTFSWNYENENSGWSKGRIDSVYVSDTVLIREKGDSVIIEKKHTEYKKQEVHDTVFQIKMVVQGCKETVEVERDFSKWESFRLKYFVWIAVAFILLLVWEFKSPLRKLFRLIRQ